MADSVERIHLHSGFAGHSAEVRFFPACARSRDGNWPHSHNNGAIFFSEIGWVLNMYLAVIKTLIFKRVDCVWTLTCM